MPTLISTKLRIAYSVLFAPGFFDSILSRFIVDNAESDIRNSPPVSSVGKSRDLRGGLHVHSTYSDGASDIPGIMEAAKRAGIDFVLVTDHNTQRAARDGWVEKYPESPALLVGAEITLRPLSFLLSMDMPADWEPTRWSRPEAAIQEITQRGGMACICLPFDIKSHWRDWSIDGFTGLEVINYSAIARRHINILSFACLAWIFKRKGSWAALRAVAFRPHREMKEWDRLTSSGKRITGFASLDAHGILKISGRRYDWPTYEEAFKTVTTHALVSDDEELSIQRRALDAMRDGRCYMAFEFQGDPTGFSYVAESGGKTYEMGEEVCFDPSLKLRIRTPQKSLIRILRNGRTLAAMEGCEYLYQVSSPGTYRVEVYRYARRIGPLFVKTRPWIFSNPIYIEPSASQESG